MVETATNTEGSILTTTRDGHVVVLAQTPLGDGLTPVGIIAVLPPVREAARIVKVVNLRNAVLVRSVIILTWG